jgi:hypothetical protein
LSASGGFISLWLIAFSQFQTRLPSGGQVQQIRLFTSSSSFAAMESARKGFVIKITLFRQ